MRDVERMLRRAEEFAALEAHTDLAHADANQMHSAISRAAMLEIGPDWLKSEEKRARGRRACYLSAEYLVGRMVYNNLYCAGLLEETKRRMAEKGADLARMEDVEDDAFGNGGLGRLAACFLDSAATMNLPLDGYGLRYRYGLFKQSFDEEGRQKESPDDWARFGDPWSVRREDESVIVSMRTGDVRAVPYDMPVIGYGTDNIGTLRLWQCESLHEVDFDLFNRQKYAQASADKNRAEDITKFLYPNDTMPAGKAMRVKQQYVLVSASIQDMLRRYRRTHDGYDDFAAEYAVQLNDTHPVMAIPELIRLLELEGVEFEDAFAIAQRTFAYTNHTVMPEALEKWDLRLLRSVVPEIVEVMEKIDGRFCREMAKRGVTPTEELCIIQRGTEPRVHMAQLAVYASHAVNGVAEIHTEILKKSVLSAWYALYPERFQNKTNGITQRRWLGLCNPELTALLTDAVGDGFLTDLYRLDALKTRIDDDLCRRFLAVKAEKKRQLAEYIRKAEGVELKSDMLFDVQVKRLHEYKRQLMNALSILVLYHRLKAGTLPDFYPTAFLFGAKAAPGYDRAKTIIRFINQIAEMVNADADTNERLRVVFVQNYNCSYAERIIPAADVSEQISPSGTEASGTSNMKLMLNGAVTLGTFDGANVEIVEQAGRENNYIFGATVEELEALKATGYHPREIYDANPELRRAMDTLIDGTFPDADGGLHELYNALLDGASWHMPDHYFLLKDFDSYLEAKLRANRDYANRMEFAQKCLANIAGAGKFSSDRTIGEYARDIWRI